MRTFCTEYLLDNWTYTQASLYTTFKFYLARNSVCRRAAAHTSTIPMTETET